MRLAYGLPAIPAVIPSADGIASPTLRRTGNHRQSQRNDALYRTLRGAYRGMGSRFPREFRALHLEPVLTLR